MCTFCVVAQKITLPVRVDPSTLARLDALGEAMARAAGMVEIGRSDVARTMLLTGIAEHEKRLGIVPAAAPPPKAEKGGKRTPRKA